MSLERSTIRKINGEIDMEVTNLNSQNEILIEPPIYEKPCKMYRGKEQFKYCSSVELSLPNKIFKDQIRRYNQDRNDVRNRIINKQLINELTTVLSKRNINACPLEVEI